MTELRQECKNYTLLVKTKMAKIWPKGLKSHTPWDVNTWRNKTKQNAPALVDRCVVMSCLACLHSCYNVFLIKFYAQRNKFIKGWEWDKHFRVFVYQYIFLFCPGMPKTWKWQIHLHLLKFPTAMLSSFVLCNAISNCIEIRQRGELFPETNVCGRTLCTCASPNSPTDTEDIIQRDPLFPFF